MRFKRSCLPHISFIPGKDIEFTRECGFFLDHEYNQLLIVKALHIQRKQNNECD